MEINPSMELSTEENSRTLLSILFASYTEKIRLLCKKVSGTAAAVPRSDVDIAFS